MKTKELRSKLITKTELELRNYINENISEMDRASCPGRTASVGEIVFWLIEHMDKRARRNELEQFASQTTTY